MTQTALKELFGDVIDTYTREQAIEDGSQVLLKEEHAEMAKEAGWKYPVYITSGVWSLIKMAVNNKKHCNDLNGVVWDVLYMARFGQDIAPDTRVFKVTITGCGKKRTHVFYMQIGPTDINDPAPAMTIMLPEDR